MHAERMELVKRLPRRRVEPLVGLREIIRELSVHSGEQWAESSEQDTLVSRTSLAPPPPSLSPHNLSLSTQSFSDVHCPAFLHSHLLNAHLSWEKGLHSRVWDPTVKMERSISIIPLLALTDHSKKQKSTNERSGQPFKSPNIYFLDENKFLDRSMFFVQKCNFLPKFKSHVSPIQKYL